MALAIVRTIADLRAAIRGFRGAGETVGLVPTMGALHQGHLALATAAKRSCKRVAATIFVNPTQFGANEDLAAYPRDEARDVAMLQAAGCDLVFAPGVGEIYPAGFATEVKVTGLTEHLCGIFRPGHFQGVATVVAKLLNQAQCDRAFFGEKDFQQLQVIRRMARDLDIPTEIVGVPTVREADGLAMSSRNRYLTPAERAIAGLLPRFLQQVATALSDGAPAAPRIDAAKRALSAAGFSKIDYVELCDEKSLQPIAVAGKGSRLFAAAYVGRTRLIDNWPVL